MSTSHNQPLDIIGRCHLTLSERKQTISVIEWFSGRTGTEIFYAENGVEGEASLTPEQCCRIFKQMGIIQDYRGPGEWPDVQCTMEDMAGRECFTWVDWGRYMHGFDGLSQKDAVEVVARHLDNLQTDAWAKDVRSIPAMVKSVMLRNEHQESQARVISLLSSFKAV